MVLAEGFARRPLPLATVDGAQATLFLGQVVPWPVSLRTGWSVATECHDDTRVAMTLPGLLVASLHR